MRDETQQVFSCPSLKTSAHGVAASLNAGSDGYAKDLSQEEFEQAIREAYEHILPENAFSVAIPELRKRVVVSDFDARLLTMQDRGLANLLKPENTLAVSDEESVACPNAPDGGFYYQIVVCPNSSTVRYQEAPARPREWPDLSETTLDNGNINVEELLGCENGKGRVNLLANVKIQYLDDNHMLVETTHQLHGKEVPVNSAEVRTYWQEDVCKKTSA